MDTKENKISTLGFFNYFKKLVGWHIYGYIILNFLVGLMDGLGLTMFIPVIKLATQQGQNDDENLGKFQIIADGFHWVGLDFNLTNAVLLIVFIFIIKAAIVYAKLIYFNKLRLSSMRKVRLKLADALYHLSYEGFTKMDSGKLQNSMTQEAVRVIAAMIGYFTSIQNIVMLTTYVGLAVVLDWQFAILVAIGGILSNFFYKYLNHFVREKSRQLTAIGEDFFGHLVQAIHNFKYLKATNSFNKYIGRLKKNILLGEEVTYKMNKITSLSEALREPSIMIIICAVLMIQIQVLHKDIGPILASLLMFYRSLGYLVSMQNSYMSFISSSAGVEAIEKLFSQLDHYSEKEYAESIEDINTISAKNITLNYGTKTILDHINLTIKKNTSVAFVGESGAGKTTLANIICGLQAPTSGTLMVNDKSIYHTNLASYRNKIGYITQEPVIFDDTLFNNVTFWAPKTEENLERFWRTLEMVSLRAFALDLENKEDAPLGNNGILISGGQKQRISIARELYKDIELLIMDEATSALDSETERFIKENIDMLHGKLTMVIIAHRLSTIKNVDHICLLEKGKIINSGQFQELVDQSDKFKRMVALQEI
ncbi:ABC transporter ATP-binding protein [Riemerella columbina]|uniref:ABC transporter ATP-binding protein n=1 Tax=Riemerella columbina TaxID=103810 RepID=UPI00267049E7|nr:ABC transporter ATP-binding protein [Riemerella columbina]WKS95158.1 ABC transporter ATP-binding protein/permease [Riemerella columbina]